MTRSIFATYPKILLCFQVLTVAGSGNKVDICTNFGYKAFSVVTC